MLTEWRIDDMVADQVTYHVFQMHNTSFKCFLKGRVENTEDKLVFLFKGVWHLSSADSLSGHTKYITIDDISKQCKITRYSLI